MVQMSMVKRTLDAKRNAGTSVIAMQLAKDNNDILWKKASKFKKMFQAAKIAVAQKYGSRARMLWTKKQSEAQNKTKVNKQVK